MGWERLRAEEKGATDDEMVGWHQFNGHEFEQTPGDSKGQGSLACCSSWGRKESDTTERLNNNNQCEPISLLMIMLTLFHITLSDYNATDSPGNEETNK